MAYGMMGQLGMAFQDSFGTINNSANYYFMPIISENISEKIEQLQNDNIDGRYDVKETIEGAHSVEGDFIMEAHPMTLWFPLQAWCNQRSSADISLTSESTAYQHVFKPSINDFDKYAATKPFTIQVYRDAGSAYSYYDCLMNNISFEFAHGAFIKTTCGIMGGKFTKTITKTASYEVGSLFTWNQVSVSLGGSGIDYLTQLTIAFNNNLEARRTIDGTKTASRIKRSGRRTIEISGTFLFENDTQADIFRNQTKQRLVVSAVGNLISSSYNEKLTIDIPSMKFKEYPIHIGGTGKIEVSFGADASYNIGSGTMASINIINTQSL